eukprot:228769-Prymnesium_polylepis.1
MKRSAVPKAHCGAEFLRPSTCVPTALRSEYTAGPGETRGAESLACSGDVYTRAWCSRVLLPKPYCGADCRLESDWSPNIERVDIAAMVAVERARQARERRNGTTCERQPQDESSPKRTDVLLHPRCYTKEATCLLATRSTVRFRREAEK